MTTATTVLPCREIEEAIANAAEDGYPVEPTTTNENLAIELYMMAGFAVSYTYDTLLAAVRSVRPYYYVFANYGYQDEQLLFSHTGFVNAKEYFNEVRDDHSLVELAYFAPDSEYVVEARSEFVQ